jgi:hypothetical protein
MLTSTCDVSVSETFMIRNAWPSRASNRADVGPPIFVAGLSGYPGAVRLHYAALTAGALALPMSLR